MFLSLNKTVLKQGFQGFFNLNSSQIWWWVSIRLILGSVFAQIDVTLRCVIVERVEYTAKVG